MSAVFTPNCLFTLHFHSFNYHKDLQHNAVIQATTNEIRKSLVWFISATVFSQFSYMSQIYLRHLAKKAVSWITATLSHLSSLVMLYFMTPFYLCRSFIISVLALCSMSHSVTSSFPQLTSCIHTCQWFFLLSMQLLILLPLWRIPCCAKNFMNI